MTDLVEMLESWPPCCFYLDSITERICCRDSTPVPGLIIPFLYSGPFLDCHVWLTQSAATRMGVHPSLESPAVSSYIIAEPCWARRTALCACHWMWLWLRLSGGWEATVRGFLPGLQQRRQNKQNQRFWRALLCGTARSISLFHTTHCADEECFLAYTLDVLCVAQVKTCKEVALLHRRTNERSILRVLKWANGINQMLFFFFALALTICWYWFTNQMLHWIPAAHSDNQYCLWNIMQCNEFTQ